MKEGRKYMNLQEAADFLELRKTYLYKLVCLKKIPYIKYGRMLRFDEEDLKTWKQSRMVRIPSRSELEGKAAMYAAANR